MAPNTVVNIDEISQEGRAVINNNLHTVKPMNAKMITVARSDRDPIEKLLTIVANRVPSLSAEDVSELTLAQLEAIVDIANAGVNAVEQAAPNVETPTTETPVPTPATTSV